MIDVKTAKWKYLRENDKKFYDPNRNTALNVYLDKIFPGSVFVYNSYLPKERAERFHKDFRRFKPDARCEELNLVIEFDGVAHYQDLNAVIKDHEKDVYYHALGYKLVRIPYWIQLSNEAIKYYFNVDVDEPMCELPYSFYDPDKEQCDLHICPGSMCYAGLQRFIAEVNAMPYELATKVYEDIMMCIAHSDAESINIVPEIVAEKLRISDAHRNHVNEFGLCMLDIRDKLLFSRNYYPVYYPYGCAINTDYPYESYVARSGIFSGTFPDDQLAEQAALLDVCKSCPSTEDLTVTVTAMSADRSDGLSGCIVTQCTYYRERNTNTSDFYDALTEYAAMYNKEMVIMPNGCAVI